ncbi:MAG: hypothetical protein WDO68_00730 [Gammaproteobacteria bacterium]
MLAVGFVVTASDVAADDVALPTGSRVGIIVMMQTDVTHYHVGKNPQGTGGKNVVLPGARRRPGVTRSQARAAQKSA